MSELAQALNAVRQEVKFYRILLLSAALEYVCAEYRREGQSLPSIKQLSEEIEEHWRSLAISVLRSGAFADMDGELIRQIIDDMVVDLPQFR